MITQRLLRQLAAVNWDFPRNDLQSTSAIHWYPGTFPSQLPGALIEALSDEGAIIVDPYGGIGTTAVEALRLGRKAWSVDQSPLGCLAAYVMGGLVLLKAQGASPLLPIIEIQEFLGIITVQDELFSHTEVINIDDSLNQLIRPLPVEMHAIISSKMPSNWSMLSPWFESSTLKELKKLLKKLYSSNLSSFGKLLGLLMISSALRPASSQTRSWGHIADNVWPTEFEPKDINKLCQRWLYRVQGNISRAKVTALSIKNQKEVRFWSSQHNWRSNVAPKIHPRSKCNALITSPPYANAIDYTRAQRLSLYLLGYSELDINTMGLNEIGARRKRFSPSSEANWGEELATCLNIQLSFIAESGFVAVVLPHEDHGREAGSIRLGEILTQEKWGKVFEVDRSIRQGRTRQSWTSIKRETIEVFQHSIEL